MNTAFALGVFTLSLFGPNFAAPVLAEEPGKTPLFVSGTEGYGRYRIPSLIVSSKGTLLAFCEGRRKAAGLTGDIDLVLRRSFDNGRSWQPLQQIADDGPNTLGNPCPVIDSTTGTIWLLLTRSQGQDTEKQIVAGESTDPTRVWIMKSDDDGATWSKPVDLTPSLKRPDWTWYGTGPGIGLQLRSGRLLVPSYHADKGTGIYRSHMVFSDDHGKTWKLGDTVGEWTSECQVAVKSDGSLYLNARSIRQTHRTIAISRDDGVTWSAPKHDANLTDPDCEGSIFVLPAAGADGKPRWLFSNPPGPGRRKLTVRLSDDEGQRWPFAKIIEEGSSEYSSLAKIPDGSIGCLYERSPGKVYSLELVFARFSVEWLTGKEK